MNQDRLEQLAFELISFSGSAKALFLEAVDAAIEGNYALAEEKIQEGKKLLQKAHKSHMDLLIMDSQNEKDKVPLLLIHSEDQFMSCEESLILAKKTIKMMKKIFNHD